MYKNEGGVIGLIKDKNCKKRISRTKVNARNHAHDETI